MADYLVQEDGTSKFVLEDSSGDLLLELQTPTVPAGFISSVTAVYTPQVAYGGTITFSTAGTFLWVCPAGVTAVDVICYGGGGGGNSAGGNSGHAAGGGGAYAQRRAVPVTPGTVYTVVVGAAGPATTAAVAGDSTFTGDSGVQVIAKGGAAPSDGDQNAGVAGQASGSTGDSGLVFSGGDGGAGVAGSGQNGAGGGASGNVLATGTAGTNAPGRTGATGLNGGGSGGTGGTFGSAGTVTAGGSPGGGGGGAGGLSGSGASGADGQVQIFLIQQLAAPFIASVSAVYTPTLVSPSVVVPFISSVTIVYTPTLSSTDVRPDFIDSNTLVYVPNLKVAFTGGGVSQVALEVITQDNASPTANVTQVTLEIVVPNYKGLHVHERT